MFSRAPEPAPEPDDELDENIFTYQPETLDCLTPGTVLIVEGGALTRADIERLSELGSDALRAPLVLPSGVGVSVIDVEKETREDVEKETREPKTRSPAEFLRAVSQGQALVSLNAGSGPKLIVDAHHIEHDRDIYRRRDLWQITGKLVTKSDFRAVMVPELFGFQVTEQQFTHDAVGDAVKFVVSLPHDVDPRVPFDFDEPTNDDRVEAVRKKLSGRMFGGVDFGTGSPELPGATTMIVETKPFKLATEGVFVAHGSVGMKLATHALHEEMKRQLDAAVERGEISGYSAPTFEHNGASGELTVFVNVAQAPKIDDVVVHLSADSPEGKQVRHDVDSYLRANPNATEPFRVAAFNRDVAVEALRQAGGGAFTREDFDRLLVQVGNGEMTAFQASEFLPITMLVDEFTDRLEEAERLSKPPERRVFGKRAWLDPGDFGGSELRQHPPEHPHCSSTTEPDPEWAGIAAKPYPKPSTLWSRISDGEVVAVTRIVRTKHPADSTVHFERRASDGRALGRWESTRLGNFWREFDPVGVSESVEVGQRWLDSHGNSLDVTNVHGGQVYYHYVDGAAAGAGGVVSIEDFKAECNKA
jgi:hypothetical protein